MKYSISVTDTDGKIIETIEGDEVDEVHQKVLTLRIGHWYMSDTDKNKLARELANTSTQQIKNKIENQSNLLEKSLKQKIRFSWSFVSDEFNKNNPEPESPIIPPEPTYPEFAKAPDKNANEYQPAIKFRDKFSAKKKRLKILEAEEKYKLDYAEWEKNKKKFLKRNLNTQNEYNSNVEQIRKNYNDNHNIWMKKKSEAIDKQHNFERSYVEGKPEAVAKYFEILLKSSHFDSEFFERKVFTKYYPENKLLYVEYYLPDKSELSSIKEIKYVAARKEFQEVLFSETQLNKRYDNTLYEITLKSLNEIFAADNQNYVDQVGFNGKVETIDPSTGQTIRPCIISLSVSKDSFRKINLANINPKDCFKGLKGVSAAKLHTLSPITPIMQFDKNDKRFIEGYSVASEINDQTNLAAMDWEDFEHLIREIFEKEFSQNGGEVKVTQASRDGGVDAIAFDPDPIRGGKIVIQAKRYTNVVGVTAVRDLYGTVLNEGATKGILVTTANYGADSYEFAKGKPITLLNGSNLLNLLEKHGRKAIIDLKKAKEFFKDENNLA